jgi:hypothetical protein
MRIGELVIIRNLFEHTAESASHAQRQTYAGVAACSDAVYFNTAND